MNGTAITRRCLPALLTAIGFIAFCVLAADDAPGRPMSWGLFIGSKSAALAAVILCILAGRHCRRRGLLPEPGQEHEERKEDRP